MGLCGWAIAVFIAVAVLIRLIGVASGHPVIVWLVLVSICSAASAAFAKYHNERLMERVVEKVEMAPPAAATTTRPTAREDPTSLARGAARISPTTPISSRRCRDNDAILSLPAALGNEGYCFCSQCGSSLHPART